MALVFLTLVGGVIVAARLMYPDDLTIRFEPYRERAAIALGLPDPAGATRVIELRRFEAHFAGDAATHREWMLRAVGVVIAVPATRISGSGLAIALLPTGIATTTLLAIDLWVTWTLVIAVTEWWIRRTRATVMQAIAVS